MAQVEATLVTIEAAALSGHGWRKLEEKAGSSGGELRSMEGMVNLRWPREGTGGRRARWRAVCGPGRGEQRIRVRVCAAVHIRPSTRSGMGIWALAAGFGLRNTRPNFFGPVYFQKAKSQSFWHFGPKILEVNKALF